MATRDGLAVRTKPPQHPRLASLKVRASVHILRSSRSARKPLRQSPGPRRLRRSPCPPPARPAAGSTLQSPSPGAAPRRRDAARQTQLNRDARRLLPPGRPAALPCAQLQETTEQLDISPHSPLVSTALDENGWVCGASHVL